MGGRRGVEVEGRLQVEVEVSGTARFKVGVNRTGRSAHTGISPQRPSLPLSPHLPVYVFGQAATPCHLTSASHLKYLVSLLSVTLVLLLPLSAWDGTSTGDSDLK